MRCFYHQDQEAVGSCKSCGKGLCAACAADLGRGLACRGRCEADVRAMIELTDHHIRMKPTTARLIRAGRSARLAAAVLFLVMGLFLTYGWFVEPQMWMAIIMGFCLFVYGIYHFIWSRRMADQTPETEPGDEA